VSARRQLGAEDALRDVGDQLTLGSIGDVFKYALATTLASQIRDTLVRLMHKPNSTYPHFRLDVAKGARSIRRRDSPPAAASPSFIISKSRIHRSTQKTGVQSWQSSLPLSPSWWPAGV
jgi:hypothetical protein